MGVTCRHAFATSLPSSADFPSFLLRKIPKPGEMKKHEMEGPESVRGGDLCTVRNAYIGVCTFFFLRPLKLWDLFVIATSTNLTKPQTYFIVLQREIYTFLNSIKRREKNIYKRKIFGFSVRF